MRTRTGPRCMFPDLRPTLNPRVSRAYLLATCLCLIAMPAFAQSPPVAANCNVELLGEEGLEEVSMFLVPNGSGFIMGDCVGRFADGSYRRTDAAVFAELRGSAGQPSVGVPAVDIRLNHAVPDLVWCDDSWYPPASYPPNKANGPSGVDGDAFFSRSYHGGGHHLDGTQIWVREAGGVFVPIPGLLQVRFNSADLNGDLKVDLIDVAIFSQMFHGENCGGGYCYRIDYFWDGVINLVDVALLAQAMGARCP